jgi:hypothetical protein
VSPASRLAGPANAAQLPLYRGGHPASPGIRRPLHDFRGRQTVAGRVVDWMIVGLMLLAVVTIFTVSASLLTNWKVHYMTAGGGFYEKLHPATYLTLLAWLLLLMRNGDPVGEINSAFSDAKLMLIYLFCWFSLLIQMFVLERPFTVIIDTFLLPLLLCLVIWRLTASQRAPLVWAVHLTLLLNVVIGYYEYFSGRHLIPLTLGDVVVLGEWRSSALLGHPLTASGIVGGYILALVLRPALCPSAIIRLPLIAFCLGSLMAFGGRTSLVTVLSMIGLIFCFEIFRLLRGGRTSLPMVIGAMCVLFVAAAGIFAALDLGIFDKMLLRFSSDKGSTLARFATFNLLSHFDWYELVLGPNPVRVNALQSQLHRSIRPRSHRPAHDRTGGLLCRTASALEFRRLRHRPAHSGDRGQFGEFFVEEYPARTVHRSGGAAVAARAVTCGQCIAPLASKAPRLTVESEVRSIWPSMSTTPISDVTSRGSSASRLNCFRPRRSLHSMSSQ